MENDRLKRLDKTRAGQNFFRVLLRVAVELRVLAHDKIELENEPKTANVFVLHHHGRRPLCNDRLVTAGEEREVRGS